VKVTAGMCGSPVGGTTSITRSCSSKNSTPAAGAWAAGRRVAESVARFDCRRSNQMIFIRGAALPAFDLAFRCRARIVVATSCLLMTCSWTDPVCSRSALGDPRENRRSGYGRDDNAWRFECVPGLGDVRQATGINGRMRSRAICSLQVTSRFVRGES